MGQDTKITSETPEASFPDQLSEVLRSGARRLIEEAVAVEVEEFLTAFREQRLADGRQRIVRNGYLPERELQTGLGAVAVQIPKMRDRTGGGVKFNSALVPPYIRRTPSVEAVLPWLYLKGLSTGDFTAALQALLGEEAKGLSPTTISRLKQGWTTEYQTWSQRSLAGRRYVYVWADGVYFDIRLADARQCLLVLIGVTPEGQKEFLAIEDGYRESEQSWTELLQGLKQRGLTIAPQLAIGDGALGFWKALRKLYPTTRPQRCWVHKTANILNKLPKAVQPKAKSDLHQIWLAETREAAEAAFAAFVSKDGAKYEKAVECLEKDRDTLLAFYDFPAEHWPHIRTTNPIESTFATIRLRTAKTRGCVSRQTALALVYKLSRCAEASWRKLRGFKRLGQVIQGVKFINGIAGEEQSENQLAA
jgi:transposase-like protein